MKKYIISGILGLIGLVISNPASAYISVELQGKLPPANTGHTASLAKSANCAPASASITMEFNDVSAFIEQGGSMFADRQSRVANYEVPKGGGVKAIYAGALWMGGTDVNGQLKLAALTFRSGNDFWPGPLTITPGTGNYNPLYPLTDNSISGFGPASIDPEQCLAYDKFFTIRKSEVVAYSTWWECTNGLGADGCESEVAQPSSDILTRIDNWPAHGDVSLNQAYFLAPFYDRDQDGNYNPASGDYPWYDDILGRDDVVCGVDRRVTLYGDETHWWVFNDKGNIHQESNGDPIGMEVRAQAFAFATNDEVNRMTFYNYEMINRGTQTLFNTYFSQYLDPDVGNAQDDYVGCDVSRGLGFAYNGDNFDEDGNSAQGYGENPPAIGVDFFEGPYQDADDKDNIGPVEDSAGNLITPTVQDALADDGIVYKGVGVGYGDGIVDNERFGMRRFTYYTNGAAAAVSDPSNAPAFYNYMTGKWANGSPMFFGGTGFGTGTLLSDYMFPGDSDPLFWATGGVDPGFVWDEVSSGNDADDRRFVQSAGPFTLRPGAINNITVGIVYGRSTGGGLLASVEAMKQADTKAQALFDACFEILSPPDAPKLTIQELENQLVLTLENPATSNNYKEQYAVEDKINITDPTVDRFYRFEGYQIYQMVDEEASVADIEDPNKARLVIQVDKENDIDRLINFEFDEELGHSIPVEKVNGENKGIRHSFLVTEDAFAQGDKALVNFKTYYFIAVAYAFNEYKKYDPNDPSLLDGQKIPYISSRLSYDGTAITAVAAIPHNPASENGGTTQRVDYGATPRIVRIDGFGNGNRNLELTEASKNTIISNGFMDEVVYDYGSGPIDVKVVDPLNVEGGYYECRFRDYNTNSSNAADTASWVIYRYASKGSTAILDSVTSDVTIAVENEQLIPEWGVSVTIKQDKYFIPEGSNASGVTARITDIIATSMTFADSSKPWLSGVSDNDVIQFPTNWIRAGDYNPNDPDDCVSSADIQDMYENCFYPDEIGVNNSKSYAGILNGIIAPHRLTGYQAEFMPIAYYNYTSVNSARIAASISFLPSVDIVLTSDKSKWTRVPVIELGRYASINVGGAQPGALRKSPSVDKNGNPDGSGEGMSWFPGYAIDLETGSRLYMAFGENSSLATNNGADMIWNPTSTFADEVGNPIFGGQHSVMVWSHDLKDINGNPSSYDFPAYIPSQGENLATNALYQGFLDIEANNNIRKRDVYGSISWIGNFMLASGQSLLSTDVTIKLRVNKEYKDYVVTNRNEGRPMFGWSMDDISTLSSQNSELASALDRINVVPNPYYAYSQYERSRLDTRVKITNLPEVCTIKIFSVNGKLIRTFKKDSPLTFVDWDLNNSKGIGVAGGIYLIHVDVPDVGEKIVKFFGGMRQIDLQGI